MYRIDKLHTFCIVAASTLARPRFKINATRTRSDSARVLVPGAVSDYGDTRDTRIHLGGSFLKSDDIVMRMLGPRRLRIEPPSIAAAPTSP